MSIDQFDVDQLDAVRHIVDVLDDRCVLEPDRCDSCRSGLEALRNLVAE